LAITELCPVAQLSLIKRTVPALAIMTVRACAVCQSVFSGDANAERMQKAAARRAALCGVYLEGMWQLAIRRAQVPQKGAMGTSADS
jgi:hypothetical protein